MFLLQDLKRKAGTGNYSNEQLENIAKGITKIYNTRFIDFRYRLIDQLTLLDSTLKSNGIEPTNAIKYFTTINDNWLYATRFQRFSGSRWSVNYIMNGGSNYYLKRYKNSDTSDLVIYNYQNNNLYNGFGVNYDWSKQMGLKIQNNFSVRFSSGYTFNTQMRRDGLIYVTTSKYKPDNINANLNLSYGYLYQPNTRTYIQFDLALIGTTTNQLYGMRMKDPYHLESFSVEGQLIPKLSIFKFFNPHLYYSLTASAPIYCNHTNNNGSNIAKTSNTNYQMPVSINMGFTYNLF